MSFVSSFVKRTLSTDLKYSFFSSTVIVDKFEQSPNALCPISLTFLGMWIDVSLKQPKNPHPPMDVTLSGMVIDVKEEYPKNAHPPIVVIPSLIITLSICSLIKGQGIIGVSFLTSHNLPFSHFL